MTALEVLVWLATVDHPDAEGRPGIGLPFMPLWLDGAGRWRFWCPVLRHDGRCGDYENRPQLCASYQPATDMLCCMSTPESMYAAHPDHFPNPRDRSTEGLDTLRRYHDTYPAFWPDPDTETSP